jgi:hypothetical protein
MAYYDDYLIDTASRVILDAEAAGAVPSRKVLRSYASMAVKVAIETGPLGL